MGKASIFLSSPSSAHSPVIKTFRIWVNRCDVDLVSSSFSLFSWVFLSEFTSFLQLTGGLNQPVLAERWASPRLASPLPARLHWEWEDAVNMSFVVLGPLTPRLPKVLHEADV